MPVEGIDGSGPRSEPLIKTGALASVLLFVGALASAQPVSAQTLDSARALYFNAEFEASVSEFRTIAARPDLSREDLVEALRYLVSLEQTLGHEAEAGQAARALLALSPEGTLPDGAAASAVARLDALRPDAPPAELHLALTAESAAVTLVPPLAMLPTVRLACAGGTPPSVEGASSSELALTLDPDVVALCDATALTAGGAPILTVHAEREAAPPPPPPPPEVWPWIAGAAGAVAVVVIVIVAVVATQSAPNVGLPAPVVVGW